MATPNGFLEYLGFRADSLGGGLWSITAFTATDLIRTYSIADESGRDYRFDFLDRVPERDVNLAVKDIERLKDFRKQLDDRDDVAALFHKFQIDIVGAEEGGDVISVVQGAYNALGDVPVRSEDGQVGPPAFPKRSVHLIVLSDLLIRRVRLPAVMFRFDQDPDIIQTVIAQQEKGGDPVRFFASSSDWYRNVIGVSDYLGPLLGCLAPRIWGFHCNRSVATILFSLGRDLAGYRPSPMELMQLLPTTAPHSSSDHPTPDPELLPSTCSDSIDWWIMRLDQMFAYLSDPSVFQDKSGMYDPFEHHHWMLTVGQMFAQCTSLQRGGRDLAMQRALMNTLLDAFAGRIRDTDFQGLCEHKFAKKKADEVREKMPKSVAKLLMPVADRAVAALAELQSGFFIREQRGDENLRIRMADGSWIDRPPSRAAAMFLGVLRNATHGFGHRKGSKDKNDLDARLLIHHDGDLPSDLLYLPYLYLLHFLCNPDLMRANIARKVGSDG